MAIDTDRIDDAVLALLHLTLHEQNRAWKGFDWDALGRLHQKGMIDDPANTSKSVVLTSDGLQRSTKLFETMFTRQAAEKSLSEASVSELENAVDALGQLEESINSSEGAGSATDAFNRYMQLTDRIKKIVERPEMAAVFVSTTPVRIEQPSRYPHIKVDLADLDDQLWPILRRVSYAMSDADVNEADIEQYKVEVKASSDPVGVSSRWVHVERKAG